MVPVIYDDTNEHRVLTKRHPAGRNRFCILTGESGQVVVGAYPAAMPYRPQLFDECRGATA